MKVNPSLLYIGLILLCNSCIDRYYPDPDSIKTGTLVVDAHLTDLSEEQTIRISRSDDLSRAYANLEADCFVTVIVENGESIEFTETEPGTYKASPPDEFIATGVGYRLNIVTADGVVYESEEEFVHPARRIESVYYEVETVYGNNEGDSLNGIRVFVDFEINPEQLSFYRWELIESYEFRTPDYLGFIYDKDRILKPLPPEMSDHQCYITNQVYDIYTQSTHNLSGTLYRKHPLNFISNETQRLKHRYSLMVRQYSLSERAFKYWDDLKNNVANSGIYDKQPSLGQSNICNPADPEEQVIGYFSVSGVSEKRIFIENVEGLEIPDRIFCFPQFEMPRLYFIPRDRLPIFLSRAVWPYDGEIYFGEVEHHCLDCREYKNSQGDPPEFWIE